MLKRFSGQRNRSFPCCSALISLPGTSPSDCWRIGWNVYEYRYNHFTLPAGCSDDDGDNRWSLTIVQSITTPDRFFTLHYYYYYRYYRIDNIIASHDDELRACPFSAFRRVRCRRRRPPVYGPEQPVYVCGYAIFPEFTVAFVSTYFLPPINRMCNKTT